MKKIIALLMTCLMAVSLAACSYSIHDKEKKEESGTENIQEADTEAAAETAAAEEAGTETAAEAVTQAGAEAAAEAATEEEPEDRTALKVMKGLTIRPLTDRWST